jgi:hypothetical protein
MDNTPLLVDNIISEVLRSHTHIKEQERMLIDAKLNFKSTVLKIEVQRQIQKFSK